MERGCAVYAINPKQLDRFRDRFTAAGAKDDRRDARVLADSWRTDPQAFRRVQLDHPLIVQLREWSRLDDDLGTEVTRLTNQLCALVYRVSPALLRLCPGADEPWLWAVLAEAPTPQAQQRLTVRRVARLLRAQQVRRLTAADLHAALQAPPIALIPGVVDAVTAHYQVLLPRLRLTVQQRRDATRELERLLAAYAAASTSDEDQREHPDVTILRSMPGVGKRVAARMLAEASQPLVARAYHTLRALMGVAPVTRQSGQSRTVLMRRACNTRLRDTAYHWGRVGIQHDPPSRAYLRRTAGSGTQSRARATQRRRSLATHPDALARAWRMLQPQPSPRGDGRNVPLTDWWEVLSPAVGSPALPARVSVLSATTTHSRSPTGHHADATAAEEVAVLTSTTARPATGVATPEALQLAAQIRHEQERVPSASCFPPRGPRR